MFVGSLSPWKREFTLSIVLALVGVRANYLAFTRRAKVGFYLSCRLAEKTQAPYKTAHA